VNQTLPSTLRDEGRRLVAFGNQVVEHQMDALIILDEAKQTIAEFMHVDARGLNPDQAKKCIARAYVRLSRAEAKIRDANAVTIQGVAARNSVAA
jgi:hypothetical protein